MRRPLLPRGARRALRLMGRMLVRPRFWVVYHEKYNMAFPGVPNDPLRAERILAFLASEGLVHRHCVRRPRPARPKDLDRVHAPEYLESIHELPMLARIFGTNVTADQAERLIDHQRLQTGGTVLAMRLACEHRGVAVNLGGGFHHAYADEGGGFCLFNDVAVAIAAERRHALAGPVLVIDLDLHDGNGTRALFAEDPTVHTLSIHARHWGETDAVASTCIELGDEVEDGPYLAAIRHALEPLVRDLRPGLIVYLAGCDPAHDDLLGNWRISAEGMLERDRIVANLARRGGQRVPLVILLAGGYGPEAWRYTARSLSDLLRFGGPIEPPTTQEITLKRYRHLSHLLDPADLSGAAPDDDFGLTPDDLYLPGWGMSKETRFLGFYTRLGIELVLERAGFLDRLRDLGYSHPTLDFDLDAESGQTLRIFDGPRRRHTLLELVLRRDRRSIPGMELLSIEWLLLQNPRADFGPGRPPLPGQSHPGLGMLGDTLALLMVACERLHLDGLTFVPSQFYLARLSHAYLSFLDNEATARFAALEELLAPLPFADAAQRLRDGNVVDAQTGEPIRWQPAPMVLAVTDRLKRWLADKPHTDHDERPRYRMRGATEQGPQTSDPER